MTTTTMTLQERNEADRKLARLLIVRGKEQHDFNPLSIVCICFSNVDNEDTYYGVELDDITMEFKVIDANLKVLALSNSARGVFDKWTPVSKRWKSIFQDFHCYSFILKRKIFHSKFKI